MNTARRVLIRAVSRTLVEEAGVLGDRLATGDALVIDRIWNVEAAVVGGPVALLEHACQCDPASYSI